MKKYFTLLAATLAIGVMTCTSCGEKGEEEEVLHMDTEGGTEKQAKAINQKLGTSIVLINGSTTALGGVTRTHQLNGNDCNYIFVTKTTGTGSNTMTFTWDIDTTSEWVKRVTPVNENQDMIEFNYPKKGEASVPFQFKLTKVELGQCHTVDGQFIPYNIVLSPDSYSFTDYRVAQLSKVTNGKFDIIDYSKNSAYFPTNNPDAEANKQYLYVNVYGEVVYLSPDGNWGLLGEGDKMIEFYAGSSARPFKPSLWNGLEVGAKVRMRGNMSQYNGNIQLGFVTQIEPLSDAKISELSLLDADLTYKSIGESDIVSWVRDDDANAHKQTIDGLMNSLGKVTGKIVPDSWYHQASGESSSKASYFKYTTRNYFKVQVGSQTITIAYDYHVAYDKNTLTNMALAAKYNSLWNFKEDTSVPTSKFDYYGKFVRSSYGFIEVDAKTYTMLDIEPGTTVTYSPNGLNTTTAFDFCGTLRFNGSDSNPFNDNNGVWNLCPFEEGGIKVVA